MKPQPISAGFACKEATNTDSHGYAAYFTDDGSYCKDCWITMLTSQLVYNKRYVVTWHSLTPEYAYYKRTISPGIHEFWKHKDSDSGVMLIQTTNIQEVPTVSI